MRVAVNHLSEGAFGIEGRGHRIVSDQPVSNRGHDTGMTPPELLLAALGSCAGYYAVEYLRTRGLSQDVQVDVDADKATSPARLGKIKLMLHLPELEAKHREGVLRAVNACLVKNTLLHPPEIQTEVAATPIETPLVAEMH